MGQAEYSSYLLKVARWGCSQATPHPLTLTAIPGGSEADVSTSRMPFLLSNQQSQITH